MAQNQIVVCPDIIRQSVCRSSIEAYPASASSIYLPYFFNFKAAVPHDCAGFVFWNPLKRVSTTGNSRRSSFVIRATRCQPLPRGGSALAASGHTPEEGYMKCTVTCT